MLVTAIVALSFLLTAEFTAAMGWELGGILLSLFVCAAALGLAFFAFRSGILFRSLALASIIAGAAALYVTGYRWYFVVAFVVTDVVLILLALLFLIIVCGRVDISKPQAERDDPFYRGVMNLYIEALIDLVLVDVNWVGVEKIPGKGRFLLVCNHLFLADPGIVLNAFPKSQLAFITKQENMTMPIINKFMHKILCQSMDRNNDRQALKVILKCIQLIKEDKVSIGVFPEGYTSKDGKLHPFRSGVFKIAQKCEVPVVVCTIQGTREIFRNLRRLKTTKVEFHLVDVIQPEAFKGMSTVELGDMVYEKMIEDLGEEFRMPREETT